MVFKEDAEMTCTSDPYYDLFDGGYLSPEKFLEHEEEQAEVLEAMSVISSYVDGLYTNGLIAEM